MASQNRRVASVLPENYDIQLCFLGDDGIGKSSLVQAYISQRFPPNGTVPDVLDPQQLRHSIAPTLGDSSVPEVLKSHNLTLLDTRGSSLATASALKAKLEQVILQTSPDVIILCYSQGDPTTLARLAEYWLPAILASKVRKPGWPFIPVCVCGLKADELSEGHVEEWFSVYERIRSSTRHLTDSLGHDILPDITIDMGAQTIWQAAMTQLLLAFPCIIAQGEVSALDPQSDLGLMREVGDMLYMAITLAMHPIFPIYDPHHNLVTPAFEKACKRIFTILDRDGDGKLSQDELALHQEHAFGVRVTHADMDEVLAAMQESERDQPVQTLVDAATGYLTYAGFRQKFINAILNGHAEMVWFTLFAFGYELSTVDDKLQIQLRMPQEYFTFAPHHKDALVTFSSGAASGEAFLTRVFQLYAEGPVLSLEGIDNLFSYTSYQHQPFSSFYPDCTHHNNEGGISLVTWLNLWRMLLTVDTPLALRTMYELGYSKHVQGAYPLDFDPRSAVQGDARRKVSKNIKSSVRRIYVIGSKGCGKTSVVLHYILEGKEGLQAFMDKSGSASVQESSTPTHYVASVPESRSSVNSTDTEREAALPTALVITEWPAELVPSLAASVYEQCDAILFVVDAANLASIRYFQDVVELIPDGVPCACVMTAHEARAEALKAGAAAMTKLCSPASATTLEELAILGHDSAAAGVTVTGLDMELFPFKTSSKYEKSADIFRFLSLLSLDDTLCNPQTARRRQHKAWRSSATKLVVGGVVLSAVVGCALAYNYHDGTKRLVDDKVASLKRSLFGSGDAKST